MNTVLEQLQRMVTHLRPDRLVATASGGADAYFFSATRDAEGSPQRLVTIGVDEDGDAFVLFTDRVSGETRPEDLDEASFPERAESLASEIEEFIGEGSSASA